jgi:hypothetical protein
MKEFCLADPEKKLFLNSSKGKREIIEIFIHIKSLTYEQRPDYGFIRTRLEELLTKEYIKLNYINPNCTLYDMPEKQCITDSPSKEADLNVCKSSKNVVNSSFTGSNNILFPFPTAFDNYSNLLDTSLNKNIINTTNRKLLYGMKYNDPNLNISNFHFGLQNDMMNTNRLSLFNNQANQMTKRKRKRDEVTNLEWYEEEINDLFDKDKDIPAMNNLTNNNPFNNNLPMNNLPITNPNAQNQIFIINQFNKSNMTDLEKCLLNFLIPKANVAMPCYQTANNEPINEPIKPATPKDSNINNADKLLINNIKEKLKPINQPQKNFPEQSTQPINNIPAMPMSNIANMNNMTNMNSLNNIPLYNSLNTMFPNNLFNNYNLSNGQLIPDMNVLMNNFTNMTSQNPLYTNINQTFNNFNNLTSMEMLKNMMKLYEPSNIDSSKMNYGYPDNLLNYNMFNNEVLDQLKQNVGSYSKFINDLFVSNYKQNNNQGAMNIKKKGVRLFKIEKMKK